MAYKDSKQACSETNTGLKTTEIQLDIIAIKKVDLRRTKGGTFFKIMKSLKFSCSDVKEKIFQIQQQTGNNLLTK